MKVSGVGNRGGTLGAVRSNLAGRARRRRRRWRTAARPRTPRASISRGLFPAPSTYDTRKRTQTIAFLAPLSHHVPCHASPVLSSFDPCKKYNSSISQWNICFTKRRTRMTSTARSTNYLISLDNLMNLFESVGSNFCNVSFATKQRYVVADEK